MAKYHSLEETLITAEEYLNKFPDGYEDEALLGVRESLQKGEIGPIG
jgi:hypothetical protein